MEQAQCQGADVGTFGPSARLYNFMLSRTRRVFSSLVAGTWKERPSFCPRTIYSTILGPRSIPNMLATSNYGSTSSQPHKFLPSVPSPLSPRRANVKSPSTSFWSFDTSMTTSASQQAPNQQSHVPFSSRPVKTAPIPRSDALRERRRDMFLRKVRQSRDDNKWDSRIDDVCWYLANSFDFLADLMLDG